MPKLFKELRTSVNEWIINNWNFMVPSHPVELKIRNDEEFILKGKGAQGRVGELVCFTRSKLTDELHTARFYHIFLLGYFGEKETASNFRNEFRKNFSRDFKFIDDALIPTMHIGLSSSVTGYLSSTEESSFEKFLSQLISNHYVSELMADKEIPYSPDELENIKFVITKRLDHPDILKKLLKITHDASKNKIEIQNLLTDLATTYPQVKIILEEFNLADTPSTAHRLELSC